MNSNGRLFGSDYYSPCSRNGSRRKQPWFCNKEPSPKNIQDETITSSDDSLKIDKGDSLTVEPNEESPLVDSDDDKSYKPSSESSSEAGSSHPNSPVSECSENIVSPINTVEPQATGEHIQTLFSDKKQRRAKNRNFCFFCEVEVTNFSRHILRNHNSELEVQHIFICPPLSKKRKQLLASLRNKGNYLNVNIKTKPVRKGLDSTKYLPCSFCLGLYSTKNLYRHRKQCPLKPQTKNLSRNSQVEAQNFLIKNLRIDVQLKNEVFPRMRPDECSLVAKKDPLICAFGSRYLKSHRDKQFILVTSRKMRELAKILMEVKKVQPTIKNLFTALKPHNYDLLLNATKIVSKYDPQKENFRAPTFAMNVGTTLKQCCEIALMYTYKKSEYFFKSLGIYSEKQLNVEIIQCQTDLRALIELIKAQWRFDISTQAHNDLNMKKWNKVTMVPLASDLKLLKDHLINVAKSSVAELTADGNNVKSFVRLLETVYCRVILLNRKRPGELQRLLIHTYEESLKGEGSLHYEEFSEAVSETERVLMKAFRRIVIKGKRGRGVPVLFSEDIQEHLNILLKYRSSVMQKPSVYLFASPTTGEAIVGYKVIKKYAISSGAKNPEAITCTRLRKHLATLTQLFNLTENDVEQLATFMGHTVGVHRSSYRLPDDIYQTAKITKLLLLMEKGKAGKFKGKTLDEIDVGIDEDLLEEDDQTENKIAEAEEIEKQSTYSYNENTESILQPENQTEIQTKIRFGKKRTLVPWTAEQKRVASSYFSKHIREKKPPKKDECDKIIELNPETFKNKDWLKIKVYVQNVYTKKKK